MVGDIEGWGASDMPLEADASEEEPNLSKLVKAQNKKKVKSSGFQSLGLSKPISIGITKKGYKYPTPIQKKTIPLLLEGKDVVAMARTGSGKTAAFLVPLFEKLKIHSAKVGARALIMSPTRELAMQTLSFAKELGKFTDLRAATVLGGDSIDSQFAAIHENPDIIIATPGRFSHVCVEMKLRLDTVEYVVFDEADRLFEMGFQEQLRDVINRLPSARQTSLFSATLPKILVDFARAGLTDPVLVRLDVESNLSENLKLGFFKVSSEDKLAFLIYLLKNVIPTSEPTVVFAPTKHHVELIHEILISIGIKSTYIFSSLDPTVRKRNVTNFRSRKTNVMIVTDVAARGIDIPLLDNVINFNFPPKTKLFIHRVGRVARAGRSGTAYSFVAPDELCYLLDLHMFLSQSVLLCPNVEENPNFKSECKDWDRLFGQVSQDVIDDGYDEIRKIIAQSSEIETYLKSSRNALKKYTSTRPTSSHESVRRLKEENWGRDIGVHPLFLTEENSTEVHRLTLLEKLKNCRPKRTVFEIKKTGSNKQYNNVLFMEEKRKMDEMKIRSFRDQRQKRKLEKQQAKSETKRETLEESSETDISNTFSELVENRKINDRRSIKEKFLSQPSEGNETKMDTYIPYAPANHLAEENYSVMSSFERESTKASMDLMEDDANMKRNKPIEKWNRQRKKFISQNPEKKIKTESGAWVSASMKKDLYEKWKAKMQPHENDDEDDSAFVETSADWRKQTNTNKSGGFVSLTDAGGYRNRAHPLAKNRKDKPARVPKRGPRQLRTFEQRRKYVKDKDKKMKFDKYRQRKRQDRKTKRK